MKQNNKLAPKRYKGVHGVSKSVIKRPLTRGLWEISEVQSIRDLGLYALSDQSHGFRTAEQYQK